MRGTVAEDIPARLMRLEARTVRQQRGLILLACACGCLALYVVNVIRPPDDIHADAVETLHLETTAIMFVEQESWDPVAFLSTWPFAESQLSAGSPGHNVFRPQLMLRDPGRPPTGGKNWTRRMAFDLSGDMPSIAFYDPQGELKALLTIRANGPVMELRDPDGHVVFSTIYHGQVEIEP